MPQADGTERTAPRYRRDGLPRPRVDDAQLRGASSAATGGARDDEAAGDFRSDDKDDLFESGDGETTELDDLDLADESDAAEAALNRLPGVVYGRDLRRGLQKLGESTDWDQAPPYKGPKPDPLLMELACDVTEAPTAWLWPGRVLLERVTLLAGDDDGSASLVARDLAARVSNGADWPDDPIESEKTVQSEVTEACATACGPRQDPIPPTGVVYCTTRYDKATTCVPALARAGADMTQILCLDGVFNLRSRTRRWSRPLQLPQDIESLRQAVDTLGDVALIVLDPIEAFFDRNAGPRGILQSLARLQDLAYDFGVSVVGVTRLKGSAARQRRVPEVANAILAGEASAVWGIVREAGDRNQFRMVPIKMNVEAPGPPLLIACDDQAPGRLEWDPCPESHDSDDEADPHHAIVRSTALNWLRDFLSPGPRPIGEVQSQAAQFGITPTMLKKVRTELKVKWYRVGHGGKFFYRLPDGPCNATREEGVQIDERGSRLNDFAGISNVDPNLDPLNSGGGGPG
jgi:hypothetical protein